MHCQTIKLKHHASLKVLPFKDLLATVYFFFPPL